MHEMSIAQSLLEIVLEQSRQHRLELVKVIRLQIGEMAAVVPESLSFCFDMLSKDTTASGAVIEIETLPVIARCSICRVPFQVEDCSFVCPECGEPALEMISGRELSLASIEGETNNGTDQDPGSSKYPSSQ